MKSSEINESLKKSRKSLIGTVLGSAILIASMIVTGCGTGNNATGSNSDKVNTEITDDADKNGVSKTDDVNAANTSSDSTEDGKDGETSEDGTDTAEGDSANNTNGGADGNAEPSSEEISATEKLLNERLNEMVTNQYGQEIHSDLFRLLNGLACGSGHGGIYSEEFTLSLIGGDPDSLIRFYGLYKTKRDDYVADYKAPEVAYEDSMSNQDFESDYFRAPLDEIEADVFYIIGKEVDLTKASDIEIVEINGKKYLNSTHPLIGVMGDSYEAESVKSIEYIGENTWKVVMRISRGEWNYEDWSTTYVPYTTANFYVTPAPESYYEFNVVGYELNQ